MIHTARVSSTVVPLPRAPVAGARDSREAVDTLATPDPSCIQYMLLFIPYTAAYGNSSIQKRVTSRVFNCKSNAARYIWRAHGGPREHALSPKLLDLPPHLALPLPPLDRLSLVPQVLATREAYLQLEPVLLVEVCTQPGCPTPQSQQPGPWLPRRLGTAQRSYRVLAGGVGRRRGYGPSAGVPATVCLLRVWWANISSLPTGESAPDG